MHSSKGILDLETLLLKVHDHAVIPLVREAIDCYNVGAYRAAINSIWNAIIYDTYRKAKYLAERYSEGESKQLVKEIEGKFKSGNYKREWDLIEKYLFNKFEAIDEFELERLSFIKKLRNASSHPAFFADKEGIFIPTAEQTRSCLRDAIEIILSQPPIFSKVVIKHVFQDMYSLYCPNKFEDFERFITDNYLNQGSKYFMRNLLIKSLKEFFEEKNTIKQGKLIDLIRVIFNFNKKYFSDTRVKNLMEYNVSDMYKLIYLISRIPDLLDLYPTLKGKIKAFLNNENQYVDWAILMQFIFMDKLLIKESDLVHRINSQNRTEEILIYLSRHLSLIPDREKKALLLLAIDYLPNLSTYVDAEGFIKSCLSQLLKSLSTKEELEGLIKNVKKFPLRGGPNQILSSIQNVPNIIGIFANIPKSVVCSDKDLVQTFLEEFERNYSISPQYEKNYEDFKNSLLNC